MRKALPEHIRHGLLAMIILCHTSLCAQVEYSQERYHIILEREPFGSEPIEPISPERPKDPPPLQQSELPKELRLCMIMKGDNGVMRAGLQQKVKDKKSFVLNVGESLDGIRLMSVDLEKSEAILERYGEKVTFKMEKGNQASGTRRAQPTTRPRPQRRTTTPRRAPSVAKQTTPSPKTTKEDREAIRKRLREYQMEVIRKGQPPLPIPLTPEMDDQLVKEGVLPPE